MKEPLGVGTDVLGDDATPELWDPDMLEDPLALSTPEDLDLEDETGWPLDTGPDVDCS
jgi:hypothetical protein